MCVWMFNVGVCCRVQGGWMNEWMDSCWVVFLFTSVVDEVLEHTNGTIDDLLAYLLHWTLNIALIIINILNPTPKPKKAIHIFHKYHLLQNPINHIIHYTCWCKLTAFLCYRYWQPGSLAWYPSWQEGQQLLLVTHRQNRRGLQRRLRVCSDEL